MAGSSQPQSQSGGASGSAEFLELSIALERLLSGGVEGLDRFQEALSEHCRAFSEAQRSARSRPARSGRGRGPPPRRPPARRPDFHSAINRQLQRDYRRSPRACLDNILGKPQERCSLPKEQVEAAFRERYAGAASRDWSALDDPQPGSVFADLQLPRQEGDPLAQPFSILEVEWALANRRDSAPGPDRVVYSALRAVPLTILRDFFNFCAAHRAVPPSWKRSSTILLPKGGSDLSSVSGWRPIALSSCVYKVFATLVERRLRPWASEHLLSPEQKGFSCLDGCFEHNFLLRALVEDHRRSRRDFAAAFLDLKAAFDTLPHGVLLGVLERAGLEEHSLAIIRTLVEDNATSIRTGGECTEPITLAKGVRQGCPLSPLLFNCGMELLIRAATSCKDQLGAQLGGLTHAALAYADDLVLVAKDAASLQVLLDRVGAIASWAGLVFNARKCASLSLRKGNAAALQLHVGGEALPHLEADEAYRYLGVPLGWSLRSSGSTIVQEVVADMRSVAASGLLQWQKLDAWRRFLFPRLQYALRHHVLPVQELSSPHQRQGNGRRRHGADQELRELFRRLLHLPKTAATGYLYGAVAKGGIGLPLLVEEYAMSRVADALRALSTPGLREVARAQLRSIVGERTRTADPSLDDLVAWLNGGPATCPSRGSWWTSVRWAVRHLRRSLDVAFLRRGEMLGVSLRSFEGTNPNPGRVTLMANNARVLARTFRAGLREQHFRAWAELRSQGRAAATLSRHQASTSFALNGRLSSCDWRFLHRARVDCLPLNSLTTRLGGGDRRCRRCGYAAESLAHVLQHCLPLSASRNARHHGVVSRLAEALEKTEKWEVTCDRVVPGTATNLRPDLVCRHRESGRMVILDVKVPFETVRAFEEAASRNSEKYRDLGRELGAEVITFSVGALGSWSADNDRTLSRLGLRKSAELRDDLLRHVVHWSRNTYTHAVTGVPQTF